MKPMKRRAVLGLPVSGTRTSSAGTSSTSGNLSPEWPNPSVKGTSRKRAAPYVER
jgi:hypothetical protein